MSEYTISRPEEADIAAIIDLRRTNWEVNAQAQLERGLPRPVALIWGSDEAVKLYAEGLAYDIQTGGHHLAVVHDSQRVAGFLNGMPHAVEGWAEVVSLDVALSRRRRGIGQALLQNFIDSIPDTRGVMLTVSPINMVARQLYEKFQFRALGDSSMVREGEKV